MQKFDKILETSEFKKEISHYNMRKELVCDPEIPLIIPKFNNKYYNLYNKYKSKYINLKKILHRNLIK